jgi:hypothetical protein
MCKRNHSRPGMPSDIPPNCVWIMTRNDVYSDRGGCIPEIGRWHASTFDDKQASKKDLWKIFIWEGDCTGFQRATVDDITDSQKHQQNVHWSTSNMHTSQTLWSPSPVFLYASSYFQTTMKQRTMCSNLAGRFSAARERTCTCGGVIRNLQDVTTQIVQFWSCCDLSTLLQETWRAAETSVLLSGRHGAVLPQ